jgi:hypothetical protein
MDSVFQRSGDKGDGFPVGARNGKKGAWNGREKEGNTLTFNPLPQGRGGGREGFFSGTQGGTLYSKSPAGGSRHGRGGFEVGWINYDKDKKGVNKRIDVKTIERYD